MARYKDAIEWIISNDDTDFLHDEETDYTPSVTASLVADIFDKDDETVREDLLREERRQAKK